MWFKLTNQFTSPGSWWEAPQALALNLTPSCHHLENVGNANIDIVPVFEINLYTGCVATLWVENGSVMNDIIIYQ